MPAREKNRANGKAVKTRRGRAAVKEFVASEAREFIPMNSRKTTVPNIGMGRSGPGTPEPEDRLVGWVPANVAGTPGRDVPGISVSSSRDGTVRLIPFHGGSALVRPVVFVTIDARRFSLSTGRNSPFFSAARFGTGES